MNADWFGDSYDVVKRFFVGALRSLGYAVYVDPMPTGEWLATEAAFLEFLGARHIREFEPSDRSALLLDPDTGIGTRPSRRHTTIDAIVDRLNNHSIVFAFDQGFSRGAPHLPQVLAKLARARERGAVGFYYNSHARFLFASKSESEVRSLQEALLKLGLPAGRIVQLAD